MAYGASNITGESGIPIIAHRTRNTLSRRRAMFLLRELERAIDGFFLSMSAASHIAARHRSSFHAA
jgi:hypothetical protein